MSEPTYTPVPQPPADHSVKVPHLVFGLLFLGIAGIWALGASEVISGEHLAVLGPAVLIVAGVVGLAASLANGRNRRGGATRLDHRAEAYDSSGEHTHVTDTTTNPTTDPTRDTVVDSDDEPTEEIR